MTATKYADSGISPRTTVYAERQMLKYAAPVVILDKFGLMRPMPRNKSQQIKFRRPNVFSAATVPLTEGITPSSTQFSYADVPATLKQYGQVGEITDAIADTHEDPVLNDLVVQLGENVGRTVEALTYGVLRAGVNPFYANGTARNQVNTPISLNKLRAVVKSLKAQKASPIGQVLDGSPNFATRAVEPAYIACGHTDLEPDIRSLPGFLPVAQYGSRKTVHEREFGTVENVRFVTSPDLAPFTDAGAAKGGSGTNMVSTGGTSADVYPILIFGKESYGCVPLRGMDAVEPVIIPVNKRDKSDPLGQRGYAGWKTWFTAVILNDNWLYRLEVAATDVNA